MIEEHEQVVLTEDLPEHELKALDVVTVDAAQVRPVNRRDVLHVRERPAQPATTCQCGNRHLNL